MKQQKLPSLNALRVFAVAAHADSFKQAAQQLGVSQSNITRQIQALEEQLGTRLFQRDNRVHALTAAGETLAPDLFRLFKELDRTVDKARNIGDSEAATLRVAIPESFLRWWLSSRLHEFYTLYPHIQVQFNTVSLFPDASERAKICSELQHEQLDIALHYGQLRDHALKQMPLYTPTYVPVAPIQSESPLASRPWYIDQKAAYWQQFKKAQPHLARQLQTRHVGNSNIALDLIYGTDHITLVDQLYLTHPQLQNFAKYTEYQVTLPEPLALAMKQRQRQPVALVALTKWLQARLLSSQVGTVPRD